MALQRTPPPGWPHTEAEKYAHQWRHDEAQLPDELTGPPESPQPPSVTPPQRRRGGCGCLLTLILILVLGGVVTGALNPVLSELDFVRSFSSEDDATEAFLAEYPDWEVEVSDRPENEAESVRLVVWDYSRGVGRIVLMDRNADDTAWVVRPLSGQLVRSEEDALLSAFGSAWSSVEWAYLSDAQPGSLVDGSEEWTITYILWQDDVGQWSSEFTTDAVRLPDGTWIVAGPDGELPGIGASDEEVSEDTE